MVFACQRGAGAEMWAPGFLCDRSFYEDVFILDYSTVFGTFPLNTCTHAACVQV